MVKKNTQNDTHEDVYAARLGRLMWRAAKRKAVFAAQQSVTIMGLSVSPIEPETGVSNDNISKLSGAIDGSISRDEEGLPRSLQEFLQVLAKELEQAELDPDD